MNGPRIVSLLIIVPYVICLVWSPVADGTQNGPADPLLAKALGAGAALTLLAFLCIWWPEALSWLDFSDEPPLYGVETAIQGLGWILLALAIGVRIKTALGFAY